MYKDNGRKEPADNVEIADLKGRHMKCPNCGEYAILKDIVFASTKCGSCGTEMEDVVFGSASKASGK